MVCTFKADAYTQRKIICKKLDFTSSITCFYILIQWRCRSLVIVNRNLFGQATAILNNEISQRETSDSFLSNFWAPSHVLGPLCLSPLAVSPYSIWLNMDLHPTGNWALSFSLSCLCFLMFFTCCPCLSFPSFSTVVNAVLECVFCKSK